MLRKIRLTSLPLVVFADIAINLCLKARSLTAGDSFTVKIETSSGSCALSMRINFFSL